LKIPKRYLEAVNRRTDNAMTTKNGTMIYKTLNSKMNIGQQEPHLNPVVNSCSLEGLAVPAPLVAVNTNNSTSFVSSHLTICLYFVVRCLIPLANMVCLSPLTL